MSLEQYEPSIEKQDIVKDPFLCMSVEEIVLDQQAWLQLYLNSNRTRGLLQKSISSNTLVPANQILFDGSFKPKNIDKQSVSKIITKRLVNLESEINILQFDDKHGELEVRGGYLPTKMSNGKYPDHFSSDVGIDHNKLFNDAIDNYVIHSKSKVIKNGIMQNYTTQDKIGDGEIVITKNNYSYFEFIHENAHRSVNGTQHIINKDYQYIKNNVQGILANKELTKKSVKWFFDSGGTFETLKYAIDPGELYANIIAVKYAISKIFNKDTINNPINSNDINQLFKYTKTNFNTKLASSIWQILPGLLLYATALGNSLHKNPIDILVDDLNSIAKHDGLEKKTTTKT